MKLKQHLLATALCVVPFAASAADLPMKAPPMRVVQPIPFTWTGFYVGVSGGMIAQHSTGTDLGAANGDAFWDSVGNTYGTSGISGFFGGNIGYNWQLSSNWVIGLEADIAWSGLDNSNISSGCNNLVQCDTLTTGSKLSYLGTVRGRIGYAFDRALLYMTGGLAFGRVENTAFDTQFPAYNANVTETRTGWTVGGGLEYAMTNNWTARVEALYVDLGSSTGNAPNNSGCQFGFKNKYTLGKFGVNYKF